MTTTPWFDLADSWFYLIDLAVPNGSAGGYPGSGVTGPVGDCRLFVILRGFTTSCCDRGLPLRGLGDVYGSVFPLGMFCKHTTLFVVCLCGPVHRPIHTAFF